MSDLQAALCALAFFAVLIGWGWLLWWLSDPTRKPRDRK